MNLHGYIFFVCSMLQMAALDDTLEGTAAHNYGRRLEEASIHEYASGLQETAASEHVGSTCNNSCPPNCNNCTCSISTGVCNRCLHGYWGAYCNTTCHTNCAICDQIIIGTCNICKPGRYGLACQYQCTHCLGMDGGGSNCDKAGGACFIGCKLGFWGLRCDRPCDGCSVCHRQNGLCDTCSWVDDRVFVIVVIVASVTIPSLVLIYVLLLCKCIHFRSVAEKLAVAYNNDVKRAAPETSGEGSISTDFTKLAEYTERNGPSGYTTLEEPWDKTNRDSGYCQVNEETMSTATYYNV